MKKSKKKDNKLIYILTFIVIFLIGFILGLVLERYVFHKDAKDDENKIVISEPIIKEYMSFVNNKVYLYNLNEIKFKDNATLKDFISNYKDIDNLFNDLDKHLEKVKKLYDGGTTIYEVKDNDDLFNDKLTIIRCNTEAGNRDIYFAQSINTTEAFKNGACGKNYQSSTTFTKDYIIDKIKVVEEDKDTEKFTLELTINDGKNKTAIKRVVDKTSKDILKEGKKYTFHFENKYKELITDDIKYIFDNFTLNGVVPYGK